MTHPAWDWGNPWLERATRGGVYLTERGGLVLEAAETVNRRRAISWIDAVRWPSEERFSLLQNVAIPTNASRYCLNAERAAWKHADRLLPRIDKCTEEELRDAWRRLV